MVGIVDELLNTEHRWNDTDGNTEVLSGRGEGGGEKLSWNHFAHHKSYMDCPGIVPFHPW